MDKSVENIWVGKVVLSTLSGHTEYMKNISTFTHAEVIALLLSPRPREEAIRLTLAMMGEATTGDIARALGQDRSNTGRRLESLAEDGLVECVDDCHHTGGQGRPSRLWRLAE